MLTLTPASGRSSYEPVDVTGGDWVMDANPVPPVAAASIRAESIRAESIWAESIRTASSRYCPCHTRRVIRVGLTGGIGAGKSTVARRLAELGAVVVDADALAREVVAPGTPGLAAVVAEFGPAVLTPGGELDRTALAALVFTDSDARHRLEAIVHPLVAVRTAEQMATVAPDAVVVHDIPLLTELDRRDDYDLVVVVTAPEATRLARLRGRGMAESDARDRMAAQAADAERAVMADVVLDNSGGPAELTEQVDELWAELRDRLR
jgi:dephospho-CoA kinase